MHPAFQPVNHNFIVLGEKDGECIYRTSGFYKGTPPEALKKWMEANGINVHTILENQEDGTCKVVYKAGITAVEAHANLLKHYNKELPEFLYASGLQISSEMNWLPDPVKNAEDYYEALLQEWHVDIKDGAGEHLCSYVVQLDKDNSFLHYCIDTTLDNHEQETYKDFEEVAQRIVALALLQLK